MPRTNPVSKQDLEIAARVKQFRTSQKCTRSWLATMVGTTSAAITRIELGRVPLKYGLAHLIFYCLQINPRWAASGKGEPRGYILLPPADQLKVSENASFGEVYSTHLAHIFEKTEADRESEIERRYHQGKHLGRWVENMLRDVPDGQVKALESALLKAAKEFFKNCPADDPKRILQRRLWHDLFGRDYELRMGLIQQTKCKDIIDIKGQPVSITSMQPEVPTWPELKEDIKKMTAERGAKKALADQIGVSRQVLGNWLSDDAQGAPNAGLTLELLKRVQQWKRTK